MVVLLFTIDHSLFTGFSRLQLDRDAGVANAFSLVGVRLAQFVHLGRHLSEFLLINAR